MTRALRRSIGRALIGILLFAQWAVAAYACPALATLAPQGQATVGVAAQDDVAPADGAESVAATGSTVERLMDCEQMSGALDPASPNLCAEHCRYGQQSDQTTTPTLPAVVLTSLYTVPTVPEASPRPARPSAAADGACAAATTPLAILHCRFRD